MSLRIGPFHFQAGGLEATKPNFTLVFLIFVL